MHPTAPRVLALLVIAWLACLPGCDNPSCVFGGPCSGGGGTALGTASARAPESGALLLDGPPTVQSTFPTASGSIHPDTPIVVQFSESMSVGSIAGAFEVVDAGGAIALLPEVLVGNGRIMLLLPAMPLELGTTYEVRLATTNALSDLSGTLLSPPLGAVLRTFTVAAGAPATPVLVTSFPRDGSNREGDTPEVVVVFDRAMNVFTVDNGSFDVTVAGGPPPTQPLPQPLGLLDATGNLLTDSRVFTWRSVDNQGEALSLGASSLVAIDLSPPGDPIVAIGGGSLPNTLIEFNVGSIIAPLSIAITSQPTDAIGIANLDGTTPLSIEVALTDGQIGDQLAIFLFGMLPGSTVPAALAREVDVTAPTMLVTLTEADLMLATSLAPVAAVFSDGPLAIAVRLQRGIEFTPVRRLDIDGLLAGIQDPILDVTAPTLLSLSPTSTDLSILLTDVRGLAVFGRASEPLRSVMVTTPTLGDNAPVAPVLGEAGSMLPPVVGSNANDGLFVSAPVPLDVLSRSSFETADITPYDRALNAGATLTVPFEQRGFVAPGMLGQIEVEVIDRANLVAVSNFTVYVHEDTGAALNPPIVVLSGPNSRVTIPISFMGEIVVTVEHPSFDLFTYYGAPSGSRIGVPLTRRGLSSASLQGTVSTPQSDLGFFGGRLFDSRFPSMGEAASSVNPCSFNSGTGLFDCAYGQVDVLPGGVGAVSFLAADFGLNAFNFDPFLFLKAFELRVPEGPLPGGQTGTSDLLVENLLDDPSVDIEERALEFPASTLLFTGLAGLSGTLDGDPRISVQARVRGAGGNAGVGLGLAFFNAPNDFTVRAAYPGAVDPTQNLGVGDLFGRLVTGGTIEPELYLRCEVRDDAGSVAGARPPLSALPSPIVPLDVPLITGPVGNTGASSYDVTFVGVLGASSGFYRVSLSAADGRGWTFYRASGGPARVTVPDMGAAFLVDGSIQAWASAFELPGFDFTRFAWTDVTRLHSGFAHGAPSVFTQP